MKKVTAILALVLLLVSVCAGTLRAEDYRRNNAGFRFDLAMPTDSDEWSSGNGYGFYGLFALNPGSKSKTKNYLKVSFDFVDYDSEEDLFSEGVLQTKSIGLSILWARERERGKIYYGFGLSILTNKFEITDEAFNKVWNGFDDAFWYYYGETLESLDYEEWVDDTIGYHILGGAEIELSPSLDFQLEISYSFVKADGGADFTAQTTDFVWDYIYTGSVEDELKLGGITLSVGLSLTF